MLDHLVHFSIINSHQDVIQLCFSDKFISVGADYTETDKATKQPGSMPKLLGAARLPIDNTRGKEEMAPLRGSGRELQVGEGPCQGPSLCLPFACEVQKRSPSPWNIILKLCKTAARCTMDETLHQFTIIGFFNYCAQLVYCLPLGLEHWFHNLHRKC